MSALNLNRVCLAGRLTRDPILRKTNGGTPVADIGLAFHETYTDKAGKPVEQTHFLDIVAWGKSATAATSYLKKADPLLVEGSLVSEQWETQQGEKRSRVRIRATRLHFFGAKREAAPDGRAEASASPDDEAGLAP